MVSEQKLEQLLKEVARKVEFVLGKGVVVGLEMLNIVTDEVVRADAEIADADKDAVIEEVQGVIETAYNAGQLPHPAP